MPSPTSRTRTQRGKRGQGDDVGEERTRQGRYSQSLQRGLAILRSFTPERPLLGVVEVAEELDLSRATAHRYLNTLVTLGYLEQDASRKYRLSLRVADLGLAAWNAMGLPVHARHHLVALAKRTSHPVELAVLDGLDALLVDRACPRGSGTRHRRLKEAAAIGCRRPLPHTSAGKVLLACLPAKQRLDLVEQIATQPRDQGAADGRRRPLRSDDAGESRALLSQLQQIRVEGISSAEDELVSGACGIAAPVLGESGEAVAAISVVGDTALIDAVEMIDRFATALLTAAQQISKRLGWEGH